MLSVALILPLSVMLGLLVHQKLAPGGVFLRTVLFSTYMVPMIAVALVFSKLYSPTEGPINQMLGWVGLPPGTWLSSPQSALYSIVILNVWQQVGYFTVLAVAGLTQIPDSLYEAAKIDGANPIQRFFSITLPLLGNTLLFSAVIAIINAVQVFEPVALITQGGPVNATNVLTYHIRRVGKIPASLFGVFCRLQNSYQAKVRARRPDVAELAAGLIDRLPTGLVVIGRDGLNQSRLMAIEV